MESAYFLKLITNFNSRQKEKKSWNINFFLRHRSIRQGHRNSREFCLYVRVTCLLDSFVDLWERACCYALYLWVKLPISVWDQIDWMQSNWKGSETKEKLHSKNRIELIIDFILICSSEFTLIVSHMHVSL